MSMKIIISHIALLGEWILVTNKTSQGQGSKGVGCGC